MLPDVVDLLRCPHCRARLTHDPGRRVLRCTDGRHTFDIARQGYAGLLAGDAKTGTADTPAMVAARDAFLRADHYRPIADAVAAHAADTIAPGAVIDVGAGTGHYLARALDAAPDRVGLALDISKYALRRAAKAHPRAGAAACDAWQRLPVREAAAALVLNIFAPRNPAELRRVTDPRGALVVVTPTSRHLAELGRTLGLLSVDTDKKARLDDALDPYFTPAGASQVAFRMALDREDAATVVAMGPSAWHTDPEAVRAKLAALPAPVHVSAEVTVSRYTPR